MKISRRAFQTAMLSTPALAQAAAQAVVLPAWNGPSTAGDAFAFPGAPSPRERWNVPGPPRKYFSEWLAALFERTLAIDESSLARRIASAQLDRQFFHGPHPLLLAVDVAVQ
jgi:hypothetical protein